MNIRAKMPPTFTSRQFNQDTASAKRAAKAGPVFITSRGLPTHVLMTKEEYDRLEKAQTASASPKKAFRSLAEALADPRPEADFDFDIPEFKGIFKGFEFD